MQIDWAVVFATIAGPIFAVWASEWRAQRRALHDRKEWVFRTLMSTRSARLQPQHVEALNHIVFAFPQETYPAVADAWNLYLAHLTSSYGETQESLDRWSETGNNLFADLIHLMAKDLKIPFSKSLIKSSGYYPKGFADIENQQAELRNLLIAVLKNGRPINIRPVNDNNP